MAIVALQALHNRCLTANFAVNLSLGFMLLLLLLTRSHKQIQTDI